jgi:hypothetical protein
MNYYLKRARKQWTAGVLCACGVGVLCGLCAWHAFTGMSASAVCCACLALFCGVHARVMFMDAKLNRMKASWF